VFTNTFLFPDVNVLLALAHDMHPHHEVALSFFSEVDLPSYLSTFYLCRVTQLGLLRLLTNRSALGIEALTLRQAWQAFDRFSDFWKATFLDEPPEFDDLFRQYTRRDEVSTKVWSDGYVVALAAASGLRLVTFDRALAKQDKGSILLRTMG
jgi:toxin-antitoxin system PIN domain toxin